MSANVEEDPKPFDKDDPTTWFPDEEEDEDVPDDTYGGEADER